MVQKELPQWFDLILLYEFICGQVCTFMYVFQLLMGFSCWPFEIVCISVFSCVFIVFQVLGVVLDKAPLF